MSKTFRGPLRLLLIAAIACPLYGCGEEPKPEPPKGPPPAAGKDPGPPTAAPVPVKKK